MTKPETSTIEFKLQFEDIPLENIVASVRK